MKEKPYISNIWSRLHFVCGTCGGSMTEELLKDKIPIMVCQKCNNSTTYYDAIKFQEKISKESVEATKRDEEISFVNYRLTVRNKYLDGATIFNVLNQDRKGNMTVGVTTERKRQ